MEIKILVISLAAGRDSVRLVGMTCVCVAPLRKRWGLRWSRLCGHEQAMRLLDEERSCSRSITRIRKR